MPSCGVSGCKNGTDYGSGGECDVCNQWYCDEHSPEYLPDTCDDCGKVLCVSCQATHNCVSSSSE